MDVVDLFERASSWAKEKIDGAKDKLESSTPCEEWNVRSVVNHLIHGQELFQGAAQGAPAAGPPDGPPPDLAGDDPASTYDAARRKTIEEFRKPGAMEKAGFTGGIAWIDQLIHGWDIAKATGQDTAMPDGLAEQAFDTINGKFPTDGSTPFFKKAVPVPDDAGAQDKLLGLSGRTPTP